MSDLADAVFGGQLLGHIIAGEELTTSLIVDAAMTADLASHMVVDDNLSSSEQEILQAKVAGHVMGEGSYGEASIVQDHFDSQIDAEIANHWL